MERLFLSYRVLPSLHYNLDGGSIAMKNVPLRFSQIQVKWDEIKVLHFTGKKGQNGSSTSSHCTMSHSECCSSD